MGNPVFTLKWGILATGGIAKVFTKDLLTDPSSREVHDVRHQVVAVASSSSKGSSEAFVEEMAAPYSIAAYGSYEELVQDPEVQIVYVATPHSHHFQNVMLALNAGKHVLCEKALTVTAKQTKTLVDKARQNKLFLMEAVWTRFLPASNQVEELCKRRAIGTVYRVIADISFDCSSEDGGLIWDDSHRALNRNLAGGALLDIGVYAVTWIFLVLYRLQSQTSKELPTVVSAISKYHPTGVDEMASVIVHFPKHNTMGIAMTGLRTETGAIASDPKSPSVQIQGSGGEIQIFGPAFNPTKIIMHLRDGKTETFEYTAPKDMKRDWGHGMFWEADECARCLREGKLESDKLPLHESMATMNLLDEVLTAGGVVYPDDITSDTYFEGDPPNGKTS